MSMSNIDGDVTPGMQLLDRLYDNKLAPNIIHFGRVLRAAGLPIGPGKIKDARTPLSRLGLKVDRIFIGLTRSFR